MTYLYNKDVNVLNGGTVVSTSNRFPVTGDMTGSVTIVPESPATKITAFGEPLAITLTPVIQLDGIYGITPDVIQTYTNGTGAGAGGDLQTFYVNTGTSVGGYGVVRSKRFIRYRAGQGALARFTAMFDNGLANSTLRAGLVSQEQALMFGYNGTQFGILRANGGKAHITILTINTAPTGSQVCTLTLNGVAHTINVTSGTATHAAAEIANHVGGYTGWLVEQVDNTVVFLAASLGPNNGTFSLAYVSGTGTHIAGTFSTKQAGVAQTNTWTPQYEWSEDTLGAINPATGIADGPNPSGMTLNPDKLNVYQINYRWLGAGQLSFAVEDEATGSMIFVHKIHYVNQHTVPHIANPSFKVGYVAYSLGSTTNLTVRGASMMAAIEGDIRQNELNRSHGVLISSGLTQNTLHHLMTVYNPLVTNGKAGALNGNYIINAKELLLKDISGALKSTDPAIIYIFFEPTSFSGTHEYISSPKNNAFISETVGTLDETVDPPICQFAIGVSGQQQYPLTDFRVAVPPGSWISIGILSTASIGTTNMALVWSED